MASNPEFDQSFGDLGGRLRALGRPQTAAEPRELEACGYSADASGAPMPIYNEESFRYFLDVERRRSSASNRPFLLLLIDLKKRAVAGSAIEAASAPALFAALAGCLRETDFIGWYHARSVVGAVLTQHADSVGPAVQATVRDRILEIVRTKVPPELASRIQVRIYRLPPPCRG